MSIIDIGSRTEVCDIHSSENDFRMPSQVLDEKTCKKLKVPLQESRLRPTAVPTQFLDLPSYLSGPLTT
ncbi:Protein of unknown function [Gryllus bimaculatus]|nr:Protein of unknown function [Gryllus bimaculatus]